MMRKVKVLLFLSALFLYSFTMLQPADLKASIERGGAVYKVKCISCHMPEGTGLEGSFPPLAKTKRLQDKGRLINIVFNGLSGVIKINGVEYSQDMMPMNLSDQETMDVLNYIRNSWGNQAPAITLSDVKKLKKPAP